VQLGILGGARFLSSGGKAISIVGACNINKPRLMADRVEHGSLADW